MAHEHRLEAKRSTAETVWLRDAMHSLCQPLTALECRLHLATMGKVEGGPLDADEMYQAFRDAQVQCMRMFAQVRAIQERLHQDDNEDQSER